MDELERKVLRRRKMYLAECIKVDDDLLESLKMSDLINEGQIKQIESESGHHTKVFKLVDLICSSQVSSAFEDFRVLLQKRHQVVAKNIEADLRMEKGLIKVDEDHHREAGLLVHRKFGTSKRVSEGEKRGIQDLIAKKLQVMKDEFKAEITALDSALEMERRRSRMNHTIACELSSQLRDFTKEHRQHLVTHAHDMITPKEILSFGDNNSVDELQKFQTNFKFFVDRISHVFTNTNKIIDDKEKCLSLLKVKDKTSNLSDVLGQKLGLSSMSRTTLSVPMSSEATQERALLRQRTKILDLEEQVTHYEIIIQELTNKLSGNQTDISGDAKAITT